MWKQNEGRVAAQGQAPRSSTGLQLLVVAIVFALIGLWYAGPSFVAQIDRGIAHVPVDGAVVHMAPGDPYDAYYRHLLPYYNVQRGHAPFYTGYQYNLGQAEPFREGMMYIPFAVTASLLAFATGPIMAFNLLALLSFSLCAIFAYLLGREVSGSRAGGWLAASIVSLAPFRIGFLFSQMFYGTDIALTPLALYAFVRFLKRLEWQHALVFGTAALGLATANIALFYWFTVVFAPFFIWGAWHAWRQLRGQWHRLGRIAIAAGVPIALAGYFLLYVRGVMAASGLGTGQHIDEVRHFSPDLADFFARWSGIETTIYLGLAGVLALIGASSLLFRRPQERLNRTIAIYAAAAFFATLALSFGTTFDDATGVHLYRFVFEHLPFANGSRTPGRIFPLVVLCAAILAPLAWVWLASRLRSAGLRLVLATALVALVAIDFKFSNVTMSTLDPPNRAYATIDNSRGTAVAIPLQEEAEHYLHATYQYYAVVNDARMVNGHSSMFPPDWDKWMLQVRPLNQGAATRPVLTELRRRGVRYIVAHSTTFEPRVSPLAVALLSQNPALRKLDEDNGITTFEIVDPNLAPQDIDANAFTRASHASLALSGRAGLPEKDGPVTVLTGWYAREAYPGQPPFRWMEGKLALLMIWPAKVGEDMVLEFDYRCPLGDLSIEGREVSAIRGDGRVSGWRSAKVRVGFLDGPEVVMLSTADIYTAPGDPRRFGCMIGDLMAR